VPKIQFFNKVDIMHTVSRSFQDLQTLKHCGVNDIISTLYLPIQVKGAAQDLFDWLLNAEVQRGILAGVNIHPAIGIHPIMVPTDTKVLDGDLHDLEIALKTKKAIAVGETGLHHGTPEEFISFKRHLELAHQYNLPVIIHTPREQKAELTKVIMKEIRKHKIERALIDHATQENIAIILQDPRRDIKIGVSIQESNLSIKEAILLYKNYSYENRFVLNSNSGSGPGDVLSIVKSIEEFEQAGFKSRVMKKLCYENALDIFGGILRESFL
jgi:predicted metal-dependent TIM-barrel fold hydrolase